MIVGKFKKPPLLSQGRLYQLFTIRTANREIMLKRGVQAGHDNVAGL